jgi:hypothetical protein
LSLTKRVKIGGSYYKGYILVVSATPGAYVLDMTLATASAINGIMIIPDTYGAGDYFKLEHLDSDNSLIQTLADTVYNVGANAAWEFDFASLELMGAGHKFRLTYTNAAGLPLNVYTCTERLR